MKYILRFLKAIVGLPILILGLIIFFIEGLVKNPPLKKLKMIGILLISAAIAVLTFKFLPIVFWIIIGLILLLYFWAMLSDSIEREKPTDLDYDEQKSEQNSRGRSGQWFGENRSASFFAGLTGEALKRKYRMLMKKYHPDNRQTGDKVMAQKIQAEYEKQKKESGS